MKQRLSETVMELRGTAMRGLVLAVSDSGAMQTVDVQTHDGMIRSGIEVYQPFGMATGPIAAGSVVNLLAMGADPGDLVALPAITPGLRFGGLSPGEVVLYDATGDRVALRQGGIVDVLAATQVNLVVGGVSIAMTAAGITITGNVTLNGSLTATGDVVAADVSLVNHLTSGVYGGSDESGPPVAGT